METMWKNFRKDFLGLEDNAEDEDAERRARSRKKVRGKKKMGRPLFLKIGNCLSRDQVDKRSCVDYMVDAIVKDKFLTVRQVICEHVR